MLLKVLLLQLCLYVDVTRQNWVDFKKMTEFFNKRGEDCRSSNVAFHNSPNGSYCRSYYSIRSQVCLTASINNVKLTVKCDPNLSHPGRITARCVNGSWRIVKSQSKRCIELEWDQLKKNIEKLFIQQNITNEKKLRAKLSLLQHLSRIKDMRVIFYCLGIALCIIGLSVLLWIYPLRHDRINIHRHLILSFLLYYSIVLTYLKLPYNANKNIQNVLYALETYFYLTMLCWMFNEGLYQFRAIYFVFAPRWKFRYYLMFGYGFPIIPVTIYILAATVFDPIKGEWAAANYSWENVPGACGYILLALNLFIMIYLIYIVHSKLKTSKCAEHEKAWKSARSFILLVFLLGGVYLFQLQWSPPDNKMQRLDTIWLEYFYHILIDGQASFVCLFYVYFSPAVWSEIGKKLQRFSALRKVSRSTSIKGKQGSIFNVFKQKTDAVKLSKFERNFTKKESLTTKTKATFTCKADESFVIKNAVADEHTKTMNELTNGNKELKSYTNSEFVSDCVPSGNDLNVVTKNS